MAILLQELLDIIVDELSEDRESLRALHSTSRSFRCRALRHLFRSIHFRKEDCCRSFLELCTASPDILDLVQTLGVTASTKRNAYQALGNHSFPNLRSLRIDGGLDRLPEYPLPSQVVIHEIPSSLLAYPITSLTLTDVNVKSSLHMRHLLCSFPTLKTLVIDHYRVCVTDPFASLYKTEVKENAEDDGPEIENLSISFSSFHVSDLGTLLQFKERPFVLRGLRKLSCTWTHWSGIFDVLLILATSKSSLQELRVCHSDVTYWDTYQRSHFLDFSSIPCISFEAPRRSTDQIIGLNWFTECMGFREHGPVRISQLYLSLHIPNFETLLSDPYELVWRSLDRALAVELIPSLEKFKFSVVIDIPVAAIGEEQLGFPQMEQAILSAFPTLQEQRKVFVQIVYGS
ncbi:hypothetical protein F5146DRAFT_560704 [Armillaria mellea]|nr:hypothetical protein F5146DRAFT_560704 [Armillaria mellea]